MNDVASRFREFIRLDRKRGDGGLTPDELGRWTVLKRYLGNVLNPGLSNERSDQRFSLRIPTRLTVTFRDEGELRSSLIMNLSHGGVFVATERPAEIGTQLDLRIEVAETGECIDVPAEVVSRDVEPDLTRGRRGMGLRFAAADDSIRRKLDELYERQLKTAVVRVE